MSYPKDLLGKFLDYKFDAGRIYTESMTMTDGLVTHQTCSSSVNVFNPPRTIGKNEHQLLIPEMPWDFDFLNFVAGATTTSPLANGVLTGPMSGCYLFKYRQHGQMHLAHVGTANAEGSADSIAAKTAWKRFAALAGVDEIHGADPFICYSDNEYDQAIDGEPRGPNDYPIVAGYFGPGGTGYSLLLSRVPGNKYPTFPQLTLKIVGVKRMDLLPWNPTIANLITFSSVRV
jgi:hypothetical protein